MNANQLSFFGPRPKTEASTQHTTRRPKPQQRPGRLLLRELTTDEQPTERLERYGAAALAKAELIEVVIGSKDSIGRELIARFGTLGEIARTPLVELQEVPGIGQAKAAALKAALELGRRLVLESNGDDKPQVKSPAEAANLVMTDMRGLDHEQLWVVLLDSRNRVLAIEHLYKGSLNTTMIRVGEVFTEAIKRRAAAVIVVHNHPSGDPTPSPEDVKVTEAIVQAGQLLDIEALDHIIIGDQRWVSLKERGLGFH